MSYPSGSTLLVTLQNGASPNTGPFDIYINSLSSSTNLIANDVDKATLSSSGYTFVTPLETFRVWAKSDSTITNADVAILGEVPGFDKSVRITGSYDSSLNAGIVPAEIFLDCGYGMQTVGTIPTNLNTCPSTVGIGTSSINSSFNTLITVRASETGSDYIKFFPNGAANSVYFYHLGTPTSIGSNISTVDICVDLAGGNYQTTPTSSINVYPSTVFPSFLSKPANFLNAAPYGNDNGWLIIKANGQTVYSSSTANPSPRNIYTPGNAYVEITSSILQSSLFGQSGGIGVRGNSVTNSLSISGIAIDGTYPFTNVYSNTSYSILTTAVDKNEVSYGFYAIPGFSYSPTATQTGNLIYAFRFDGNGFATRTQACGASTGGSTYYTFWSSPVTNQTVFYQNVNMTSVFPGGDLWWPATKVDGSTTRLPVRINNQGLVNGFEGPC